MRYPLISQPQVHLQLRHINHPQLQLQAQMEILDLAKLQVQLQTLVEGSHNCNCDHNCIHLPHNCIQLPAIANFKLMALSSIHISFSTQCLAPAISMSICKQIMFVFCYQPLQLIIGMFVVAAVDGYQIKVGPPYMRRFSQFNSFTCLRISGKLVKSIFSKM